MIKFVVGVGGLYIALILEKITNLSFNEIAEIYNILRWWQ